MTTRQCCSSNWNLPGRSERNNVEMPAGLRTALPAVCAPCLEPRYLMKGTREHAEMATLFRVKRSFDEHPTFLEGRFDRHVLDIEPQCVFGRTVMIQLPREVKRIAFEFKAHVTNELNLCAVVTSRIRDEIDEGY